MKLLIWMSDIYTKYLIWRYGSPKDKANPLPLNTRQITFESKPSEPK